MLFDFGFGTGAVFDVFNATLNAGWYRDLVAITDAFLRFANVA